MSRDYVTDCDNLTDTERRNIEQVHRWAAAYQKPGGSAQVLVDEIYADSPDVVAVLTDTWVARAGISKQAWRDTELKLSTLVVERKVVFKALHATGNVVTMEADIEQKLSDGSNRGWPFATVLYFDETGRIQRDHTYMLPTPYHHEFDVAAGRLAAETRKP